MLKLFSSIPEQYSTHTLVLRIQPPTICNAFSIEKRALIANYTQIFGKSKSKTIQTLDFDLDFSKAARISELFGIDSHFSVMISSRVVCTLVTELTH